MALQEEITPKKKKINKWMSKLMARILFNTHKKRGNYNYLQVHEMMFEILEIPTRIGF